MNEDFDALSCCVAYTESGAYCVPLSSRHRPAVQKILEGSIYEPQTIEFLVSNCGDGDIIHAGTYYGDFLPALSRACAPQAKVWAFEPNLENFRCAAITCALNGLQNIELTNAGLGAREETAKIMTRDLDGRALGGTSRLVGAASTPWSENLEKNLVPVGLTESVQIIPLDDVVPTDREISIIQLDVEGYEEQALSGALQIISRCHPILVLETLPDQSWLSENIFRIGYKVDQRIHGNIVLTPPAR